MESNNEQFNSIIITPSTTPKPILISRNSSSINLRASQDTDLGNNNRIRSRSVSRTQSILQQQTNLILPTIIASPLDLNSTTTFENLRGNSTKFNYDENSSNNTVNGMLELGSVGLRGEGLLPVLETDSIVSETNSNEQEQEEFTASEERNNPTLDVFESHKMELRRGRSYTTLLIRPSPSIEKDEPTYNFDTIEEDTISSDIINNNNSPIKTLSDFIPQILILLGLFLSSFLIIAILVATLPGLSLPHSLSEVPDLAKNLSNYRSSNVLAELHLFFVLSIIFLWKQTFSIPGSILTNVLFGSLYGTFKGVVLSCLFTGVGSTGAYWISQSIAPLVEYYFATALLATRKALNLPSPSSTTSSYQAPSTPISSSDIFSHLLLARFFPLIPYSILNVVCGVLQLPLSIFFITLVIGSFPFNFVTVSIGSVIATATSNSNNQNSTSSIPIQIWSQEVLIKLILVTLISILPLIFKRRITEFISSQEMIKLFNSFSTISIRTKEFLNRKLLGNGILRIGFNSSSISSNNNTNNNNSMVGNERRRKNKSWIEILPEIVSRRGSLEDESPILG